TAKCDQGLISAIKEDQSGEALPDVAPGDSPTNAKNGDQEEGGESRPQATVLRPLCQADHADNESEDEKCERRTYRNFKQPFLGAISPDRRVVNRTSVW